MKKILVLVSALLVSSAVYAQSNNTEAMQEFYRNWHRNMSNHTTSTPDVKAMQEFYSNWTSGKYNTSLDEYLRSQREKAQADQKKYAPTYTFGKVIDLTGLKGIPSGVVVAPVKGKSFKVTKEKLNFYVQYSRWSYNFVTQKNPAGNLELRIIPVEQKEDFAPKVTAKLVVGTNQYGVPAVFLDLNAVTIDDVNDGMGWGGSYEIAVMK